MQAFLTLIFGTLFSFSTFATSLTLPNGFEGDRAPENVSVSVLSQAQANQLFRKFAKDQSIPFKYPINGCYARATAMTRIADKESVEMAKVWAEGTLRIKSASQIYKDVFWGWHVAPVAYVEQSDGRSHLMVFDPALFKRPITIEYWMNAITYTPDDKFSSRIENTYFSTRFQYFPRAHEEYKSEYASKDLEDMKEVFEQFSKLEDESSPIVTNPEEEELGLD